jgi:hypothetical protein
MVDISLHPEASSSFSQEAADLLSAFEPAPPWLARRPPEGSRAHTPVEAEVSDADIEGELIVASVDPFSQQLVKVSIETPDLQLALGEAATARLGALADRVARHKSLRSHCSRKYVGDHLVRWLWKAKRGASYHPWADALLEQLKIDAVERAVLIPIEGIALKEPVRIGRLHLHYFTKEYFAPTLQRAQERWAGPEDLAGLERKFEAYYGRCYARFVCVAEPGYAREAAFDETEQLLSYLRFLHPAAHDVRAHCPLGRLGGHVMHVAQYVEETDGVPTHTSEEARRWGVEFDLTGGFGLRVRDDLNCLDHLLSDGARTELQDKLLRAMRLYAGGLLFEAPEHRLLHALVAIESLLLKSDNEPIMFVLGQRVAHIIGRTLPERQQIVADLKAAYKVRSGFVHHGQSIDLDEVDLLNRSIRCCWRTVHGLLADERVSSKAVRSKEQMLRELDDQILT